MNLSIGIGCSQRENVVHAAEEAAERAKEALGEGRIDLAIVLSTPHYSPGEVIPIIESGLNQTRIIGGTTAGIILPEALQRKGIAVVVFHSDTVRFQSFYATHLKLKNLKEAGNAFVKDTSTTFSQRDRKFLMFFFDGLLENMSQFISGIEKELGDYFPILAAGNSDLLSFSQTTQYHNNAASSASTCGAILGGDIDIYMSKRHGWKPLGKPRLVKKAKDNIIEKIGHEPALQLYEDFFKDNLGALKNDVFGKLNARYPLGILSRHKQEYLIRNVVDILEDGSLVCQDKVPVGSEIHLMIGNKNSCLQSAAQAAQDLKKQLGNAVPQLLLIFESTMRWQILKHSWAEEMKTITDVIGNDFPMIGMLTYGEIFKPGKLLQPGQNFLLSGNIMLMAIV